MSAHSTVNSDELRDGIMKRLEQLPDPNAARNSDRYTMVHNEEWINVCHGFIADLEERHGEWWTESVGYDRAVSLACSSIAAGGALPPSLGRFVIEVLCGDRTRPGHGPRVGKNAPRNVLIHIAVTTAVAAGLNPYRNDSSQDEDERGDSACDLVSECLQELGHNIKYKGVAKIYGQQIKAIRESQGALYVADSEEDARAWIDSYTTT